MLTSKSKTNSSFPSIKIELGNEVFFPFIDAANDIFKHFNNQTGQGIDSFGYLIVFPFLFRSNDQTSDNGIKHTLTLLAMTGNVDDALSFIVIGKILSKHLRFFLVVVFFFLCSICSTFTMIRMMMMMMMLPGALQMDWWHIHLQETTLHDDVE